MKLEIIEISNSERWDEVVKSMQYYDVYYLSGYLKAFEINGDGIPLLLYFKGEDTRAINIVMKRDISDCTFFHNKIEKNTFFDFSTVYGYGGFIIEGNDVEAVRKLYEEYCKTHNIICEFVRFHPLLQNWINCDKIYETIHLGTTVCIDTSSEKNIWENISSKNRGKIRKAIKSGLKTYWGRFPEIIDEFIEIYSETMTRDNADEYYYFDIEFYKSILNDLKDNAMWFYTKIDDEIASIAIFLYENGKMHYHLSASREKFKSFAPSNLMIYEAAMWACKNGYSELHLGGAIGSGEDSLYKFKKSFYRGEDKEFWIGKRIFNNELYEKMLNIRKNEENFNSESSYFPQYRTK